MEDFQPLSDQLLMLTLDRQSLSAFSAHLPSGRWEEFALAGVAQILTLLRLKNGDGIPDVLTRHDPICVHSTRIGDRTSSTDIVVVERPKEVE
ncbi:MAG: hypothetical protein HY271_18180 [Deltaproteobacteria bacterium]|nr:hypothetical protein [Deltaproteobacteria bacterium]